VRACPRRSSQALPSGPCALLREVTCGLEGHAALLGRRGLVGAPPAVRFVGSPVVVVVVVVGGGGGGCGGYDVALTRVFSAIATEDDEDILRPPTFV